MGSATPWRGLAGTSAHWRCLARVRVRVRVGVRVRVPRAAPRLGEA